MRSARKVLTWGVLGVAVVAIAVVVRRPDKIDVELAPVVRGALQVTVEGEGRTRVRERFVVTAPVSGEVARLVARVGDSVRAGEVVARIAPPATDATARAALRAQLAAAVASQQEDDARAREARLASELAGKALARSRALEGAGAIATAQLEQIERDARVAAEVARAAEERLGAARSERRAAQLAVAASEHAGAPLVVVRSPSTGRVLRIVDESERVVAAGAVLLEIGDPCAIEVVVDVLSTDAVRVLPRAEVRLTGWGGDGPLRGRVTRVEPSAVTRVSALGVDEQRVNVIVAVDDPPTVLGDGFRLDASIITSRVESAILVPVAALFRDGEGWGAFVARGGRARLVSVELSARSANAAAVAGGVAPGDSVVLFPSDRLRDGIGVRSR